MPTLDRKPRARRRQADAHQDTKLTIHRAMREAGRDPEAWDALRSRAIRVFIAVGNLTAEQAGGIFDAYRKRPELLPSLPPGTD